MDFCAEEFQAVLTGIHMTSDSAAASGVTAMGHEPYSLQPTDRNTT